MSQMDDQLKDESVSQGSPNGYDQQTIQQTVQQSHGTRRNIRIGRRRTSVKLEPAMWDALIDITVRTNKSINQICTEVHNAGAGPNRAETAGANFTSELRVFILDYYRAIAR
jgi:predicted DNA-binding ribbon-helix-helix protein